MSSEAATVTAAPEDGIPGNGPIGVDGTPAAKAKPRDWFHFFMLAPLVVFLLTMVGLPFVIAVLSSVGLTQIAPGLPDGFTLKGYADFFDPARPNLTALGFTFVITTIATAISGILGLLLAFFVHINRIRVAGVLSIVLKIPLFAPYLVIAFIWWTLLYPKGYIGVIVGKIWVDFLHLSQDTPALVSDPFGIGIIAAAVWMRFPVVFLIVHGLLQMVDPTLEAAARNLGARSITVIRRVYIPLTKYGVISSMFLNFLSLFIAFSIPFILGASWPQFLSVFIYVNAKDKGDWLSGYTAAVIYILIAMGISAIYTRTLKKSQK